MIQRQERPGVFGLYDTEASVTSAVGRLKTAAFKADDISVEHIKNGGILLSVHVDDSFRMTRAKDILKKSGAHDISTTGEEKEDEANFYPRDIYPDSKDPFAKTVSDPRLKF